MPSEVRVEGLEQVERERWFDALMAAMLAVMRCEERGDPVPTAQLQGRVETWGAVIVCLARMAKAVFGEEEDSGINREPHSGS